MGHVWPVVFKHNAQRFSTWHLPCQRASPKQQTQNGPRLRYQAVGHLGHMLANLKTKLCSKTGGKRQKLFQRIGAMRKTTCNSKGASLEEHQRKWENAKL